MSSSSAANLSVIDIGLPSPARTLVSCVTALPLLSSLPLIAGALKFWLIDMVRDAAQGHFCPAGVGLISTTR